MKRDGLKQCSRECLQKKKSCSDSGCRMWIDYPDEQNCCLISVYQNGTMTLREIGERIGVSFARIKQIETKAINKMKGNSLIER